MSVINSCVNGLRYKISRTTTL